MTSRREAVADWLGINRATLSVLAVIGCLGLAEELWSNFLSLHLRNESVSRGVGTAAAVAQAALYMGAIAAIKNLLEGVGYIAGGTIAQRLGARTALAVSAVPMFVGFLIMLAATEPWAIAAGALLMTNWEPLSVPATFEVVGGEVRKERRTIAFAVQSIQKRIPKIIGPAIGGLLFGVIGYWLNLSLAFGLVGMAVVLQFAIRWQPSARAANRPVPLGQVLREMSPGLRRLLTAEIFIRWGDWFARDFAVLYVVSMLTSAGWTDASAAGAAGMLLAIMATTALLTYIPVAKWVDRSSSPRPFIGLTFLLFSLFPICLVLFPRAASAFGWPVMAGLVLAYVINGLREFGEPARKSLITAGFPAETRARGVGLYWGLRSFAFCPAPLVAAILWQRIGPDATFLLGGAIGLAGTAYYAASSRST